MWTEDQDDLYWDEVDSAEQELDDLASSYNNGEIDKDSFIDKLKELVQKYYILFALIGSGGKSIKGKDRQDLEFFLAATFSLIEDFRQTLDQEGITAAYITWRASLYATARHVFLRYTMPRDIFFVLPALPGVDCLGDGKCGCWLEIIEDGDEVQVYWHMNEDKEHCEVCLGYAMEWTPLIISLSDF